MKAYKLEVLIIDHGNTSPEDFKTVIEQHRHLSCARVMDIKVADIGEWSDDHPLNCNATMQEEYEHIFDGLV